MKTTKRIIGAFALLAAFVVMLSPIASLADAGAADSSAPILFSNSDGNDLDTILFEKRIDSEDGINKIQYVKLASPESFGGITLYYALKIYFGDKVTVDEFTSNININFRIDSQTSPIIKTEIKKDTWLKNGYGYVGLKNELSEGSYSLRVSATMSGSSPSQTQFTSSVLFDINAAELKIIEAGYYNESADAQAAINKVWNGNDITDIADKTMYVIYQQTGVFNADLVGKLYSEDAEIHSEDLINSDGQHIWYFSFDDNQPAEIADKYKPGTYTMKLFAGEEELDTAIAVIPEPDTPEPEVPQFKIFVESVINGDGKVSGFKPWLVAFDGKLPAGTIVLTYEYVIEFDGYIGVTPYTPDESIQVPSYASYYSGEINCYEGHVPVSAFAVFVYENESSTNQTIQSETILVWGQT